MTSSTSASSDSSVYTLTSKFDILGALRSLVTGQRLIHLRVKGAQASILTTLLQIDADNHTLLFDGSSDTNLTKQILGTELLYFDASENGVRISFKTGPATSVSHEDRPAFLLPIPIEVIRVQRRDAFRVSTPLENPVLCTLPLPTGDISLRLEDLSSTGLGASDLAHESTLNVGDIISGCTLHLPGSDPLEVTLRLAHVREFERANKQLRNLGFAFENLRGASLNRIQRYISTLEREALARNRGFQ